MKEENKICPKNPKRITTLDLTKKNKIQQENEKWIKYLKSFRD